MVSRNKVLCPTDVLTFSRNFIFNKKYSTRDIGKYRLLEPPHIHHGTASHPRSDWESQFDDLQDRFTRHVRRFVGAEEGEHHRSHAKGDSARIQLTRRYPDQDHCYEVLC